MSHRDLGKTMPRTCTAFLGGVLYRLCTALTLCTGILILPQQAHAQAIPATEEWWINAAGCSDFFQPNGFQSTPAAACAFCTSISNFTDANGCSGVFTEVGFSGTTCTQHETFSCPGGTPINTTGSSPAYSHSLCPNGYDTIVTAGSFPLCTPRVNPGSGQAPLGDNLGGPGPAGINNQGPMCPACGDAGEPINPSIGNEHLAETDYRSNSAFALEFTRYYNSNSAVATTNIGAQWRHTFDRSLVSQTTQVFGAGGSEEDFTTATLYRPDGKITIFSSTDGVTWTPVADHFGRLNASYNTSHVLTGWTYATADDHAETYNASGRLLSIRDRAGRTQTPSYNAQGQLFQVLDSFGRKLQLTYDANGRVHTLLDPANGQFVYGYDAAGNLHTVQYPDNTVRTYAYNEQNLTSATNLPHALTGIIDENNSRYASIGYDSSGRAQSSVLGGVANSFSILYPPTNSTNTTQVTDPLGQARNYFFSGTNGVWKITGFSSTGSEAACGGCALAAFVSYDANGFIQQKKDANGIATNYTIDSRGLEESRTEAYSTTVARTTTTSWETAFHLPHEVDEPGRKTVYTHDAATGNLLSTTITDTQTGVSRTTSYSSYNTLGEPQTIDGPRTDVSDITHYLYDAQGNLSQITDPLGESPRLL